MNKKLNPFVIAALDAAIHGTIWSWDMPWLFLKFIMMDYPIKSGNDGDNDGCG